MSKEFSEKSEITGTFSADVLYNTLRALKMYYNKGGSNIDYTLNKYSSSWRII